jgi:hypothetical protein
VTFSRQTTRQRRSRGKGKGDSEEEGDKMKQWLFRFCILGYLVLLIWCDPDALIEHVHRLGSLSCNCPFGNNRRENVVARIRPGMAMKEVEELIGPSFKGERFGIGYEDDIYEQLSIVIHYNQDGRVISVERLKRYSSGRSRQ